MRDRRSEHARRVLDLAGQEADGLGHRYLGPLAVQRAMREATRARRRGIARVPRTPLEGPPLLVGRTLHFAWERADALGHCKVEPEVLLLGVLDDITRRWPRCMSNRWQRRLLAQVGLPTGYRGAARPLLDAFGVNLEELRDGLAALRNGGSRIAGAVAGRATLRPPSSDDACRKHWRPPSRYSSAGGQPEARNAARGPKPP